MPRSRIACHGNQRAKSQHAFALDTCYGEMVKRIKGKGISKKTINNTPMCRKKNARDKIAFVSTANVISDSQSQ